MSNSISISGKTYERFIQYFIKRCDTFSIVIPDYSMMDDELCDPDDCRKVSVYLKNMQKRLEPIHNRIISYGRSKKYFDQETNYFNNYYVVRIDDSPEILDFLLAPQDLFHWIYPKYPEDLCFYQQGKRIVQSIAHEKMCFLYPKSDEDIAIINELKLTMLVKNYDDFFLKY